jgi:hypothetical protein
LLYPSNFGIWCIMNWTVVSNPVRVKCDVILIKNDFRVQKRLLDLEVFWWACMDPEIRHNLKALIDLDHAAAILVRNKRFNPASLALRSTRTCMNRQKQRIYSPGTVTWPRRDKGPYTSYDKNMYKSVKDEVRGKGEE